MSFRIGTGYDVHALKKGLPLILGGVKIEHDRGLVGHSDADVLLHAICDALLGSLALGDIGQHFPDTSSEYKGIDSKILLKRCYKLVRHKNFRLVNLDATLMLERPKIKSHIPEMRHAISEILETPVENISIKATTTEKLGFTGREEGVAAEAMVLIESIN
ncbi:MAG: 2-C-methyl-D-erythritol 2,4-cyclodiphosphate synthase [Bacteroidales bacterium]